MYTVLKLDLLQKPENTVRRRVRARFSLNFFTGWGREGVKCAAKANWFAGGDTPFSLCGYCP